MRIPFLRYSPCVHKLYTTTLIDPGDLPEYEGNLFHRWNVCCTFIKGAWRDRLDRGDAAILQPDGVKLLCGAISCRIGPVKFNGDLQFFIIAKSLMQDGRRSVNSLSDGDRAIRFTAHAGAAGDPPRIPGVRAVARAAGGHRGQDRSGDQRPEAQRRGHHPAGGGHRSEAAQPPLNRSW